MRESTEISEKNEFIIYFQLPLAVYREISAHLQQIEGIRVDLVAHSSREFDYNQSQIGGLAIRYDSDLDVIYHSRIRSILDYYAQKYGAYTVAPID